MVKNWPANAGLDPDYLLKGMATHSSNLAWVKPIDRGAWRAGYSLEAQESDPNLRLNNNIVKSQVRSPEMRTNLMFRDRCHC